MRENADQKKSEYGHFSSNENLALKLRHSLKFEKQINCSAVKFFVTDNLIMVNNSLIVIYLPGIYLFKVNNITLCGICYQ